VKTSNAVSCQVWEMLLKVHVFIFRSVANIITVNSQSMQLIHLYHCFSSVIQTCRCIMFLLRT